MQNTCKCNADAMQACRAPCHSKNLPAQRAQLLLSVVVVCGVEQMSR